MLQLLHALCTDAQVLLSSISTVLIRTADLLRAALRVHQHGLSAELALIRDHNGTDAMLSLDKAGRCAAHDVLCAEHNLLESEVTLLKL